jgi:23S rRNA pseudouridine955/2504/2580 synthase
MRPVSASTIFYSASVKACRKVTVRVNKGRIDAAYRLEMGDLVRVPPIRTAQLDETPVSSNAPAAEFPILFEDDHLIVIDKPAGVAVHGGSGVAFGVIEQLRNARPQAKFLELVLRRADAREKTLGADQRARANARKPH